MKLQEVLLRLTGISTPIFGISWDPPEAESTTAKRIVAFLEDRRVLYVPSEMEVPAHCVDSVLRIRGFLTSELESSGLSSELAESLRAMRMACRKFLRTVDANSNRIVLPARELGF